MTPSQDATLSNASTSTVVGWVERSETQHAIASFER